MDRNKFIQCMKSNIELSDKERRRIIRRSVESQPWKLKCTIAMEEFAGQMTIVENVSDIEVNILEIEAEKLVNIELGGYCE